MPGWNDICTDAAGRVYAGSIRFAVFDPNATPVPGELWRIDAEGDATCLYDNVLHANGVVLSPGGQTIYHSDTRNNVILVHTIADDGSAGDRRAFHFPPGAPDGMAVDAQGLIWVASARAGCVARLTPDGEIDRVLDVPAQTVTSLCFAGDGEGVEQLHPREPADELSAVADRWRRSRELTRPREVPREDPPGERLRRVDVPAVG